MTDTTKNIDLVVENFLEDRNFEVNVELNNPLFAQKDMKIAILNLWKSLTKLNILTRKRTRSLQYWGFIRTYVVNWENQMISL